MIHSEDTAQENLDDLKYLKNLKILQNDKIVLDKEKIKKLFSNIDKDIFNHDNFFNLDSITMKTELNAVIVDYVNSLHEKLEEIKLNKLQKIDLLFEKNFTIDTLKSNIDDLKRNINSFIEKNNQFLKCDKFEKNSEFKSDTLEILNLIINRNREISSILANTKEDYEKYKSNLNEWIISINKFLQSLTIDKEEDEKTNLEIFFKDFENLAKIQYEDIKTKLQEFGHDLDIMRLNELNSSQKLQNKRIKNKNTTILSNSILSNKKSPNLNKKIKAFSSIINTEISQISVDKNPLTSKHKKVVSSFNINEISQRSVDREKDKQIITKTKCRFRSKSASSKTKTKKNRFKVEKNLLKDEKEATTEPLINIECYFKPIIGTSEIQIYDRKKRILIKKKVELDKHIHGYTNFMDGCRHLLIEDKLFITGGRDVIQEYNVVLTYDLNEFILKRYPDMISSHSYHSIEYNDVEKSIIILGGQNNHKCEIFYLQSNKWHSLPELNFSRANVTIHLNKSENQIYSLFGLKGDITQKNNNSDVIEFLDLKDLGRGWVNINYINKTELDFKHHFCQFFKLSDDKLLIYGANDSKNHKSFAIFIKNKNEIVNVDRKLIEEIRIQSKKNIRLSIIVSSLMK